MATGIVLLALLAAACAALVCAFHSRVRSRHLRTAWTAKLRVLEIEQDIVRFNPCSESELFVSQLVELVCDDERLREIHERAEREVAESGTDDRDLRHLLRDAVGDEDIELVSEALREAARASHVLGTQKVLHSEVRDRDLVKESFALFGELMSTAWSEARFPVPLPRRVPVAAP